MSGFLRGVWLETHSVELLTVKTSPSGQEATILIFFLRRDISATITRLTQFDKCR